MPISQATKTDSGVAFKVDDVTPAESPLETCKPLEAVRALSDASPTRFAADESSQGNPTHGRIEACWNYALDCLAEVDYHPLLAAAHLAFSQHRPLVLSPDVIWVTIVQGLAQHVRQNPESCRSLLVKHEGKRNLTVEREDLHRGSPENPWADVVADFAALLRGEVGELAERFVCDFSTTGPIERTVSEIAMLDILKPYYSYNVVAACGIPTVTLEGTAADWRRLRDKVDLLAPFDLDWWLSELRPICDQFVRASVGDVDLPHWQRLYKIRRVYAAEIINGWLGKLFPYTAHSERNPLLDPAVEVEIRKLEEEEKETRQDRLMRFGAPGVQAESLPRGLSQVPFTFTDRAGKRAMDLLAGPMVVTQDRETGVLRPTLGWAVREAPPIEQAMLRLAEHRIEPATAELSWDALDTLRGLGIHYVPTDILRFYRDAASATILDDSGSPLFRILPLAKWKEPEWAQKWRVRPNGEKQRDMSDLFHFAESSDGTEFVIQLYCRERKNTGMITVGRRRGEAAPATGTKVARSFTEFLLRALDEGISLSR